MTYKASSIQPDKNISILFKSPPGFGKTVALASFAVFGPIWLAYFDKKSPIEVFTFFQKHRPDLLDNINIDTYTAATANEYLNKLNNICEKEPGKYVALGCDSVTNMTTAAVNWSMGFRGLQHDIADTKAGSENMIPGFDDYKVETSYAAQALDLTSSYPGFNLWTAHPLISLDMKGSGSSITSISTKQTLVSYGSKVGQLIPGRFQEIYHFARQGTKRVVWTDMVGDDYAKTCYNIPKSLDITDRLFAEVWRDEVNKSLEVYNEVKPFNPMNPVAAGTNPKWKV